VSVLVPSDYSFLGASSRKNDIDSRNIRQQIRPRSKRGSISNKSRGGAINEKRIYLTRPMPSNRLAHQPRGPDLSDRIAIDVPKIIHLEQARQVRAWAFQWALGCGGVQKHNEPWQERVWARVEQRRGLVDEAGIVHCVVADQSVARGGGGVEEEVEDPACAVDADGLTFGGVEYLGGDGRLTCRSCGVVGSVHLAVLTVWDCVGSGRRCSIGDGEGDVYDVGD